VNVPVAATDDLSPPYSSSARPAADQEPDHPSADTRREPIDQKSAGQFQSELKEEVKHSRGMMALPFQNEKTGKSGHRSLRTVFKFSRLCSCEVVSYADLPMPKPPKPTKLTVIWETVPDPDTHALLKAVAMLFKRRIPLSTGVDLTKADKTLMCRRPADS